MDSALPPQVICLGEALVDRLDPPDGDRLGGAPANVACGLARLGTPVAFVGRLGRDGIGEAFAEVFAARGVDTRALQWDDRLPSRIVLVHRDASGERSFGGFAGGAAFADQALDAGVLSAPLGPLLAQARWLLVGTIPLASAAAACRHASCRADAAAAGVALALDVNWRPTFWDATADPASGPGPEAIAAMRPLIEQAALIKCAREEAEWLFGSTDAAAVSAALPQRPAVLVTDGGSRLSWCFGGRSGVLPAFPVTVVDSTGAGDAFTAGLLHRLCAEPQQLEAALRFAVACGAMVCQGAGAIDPQPDCAQVGAFLATQA